MAASCVKTKNWLQLFRTSLFSFSPLIIPVRVDVRAEVHAAHQMWECIGMWLCIWTLGAYIFSCLLVVFVWMCNTMLVRGMLLHADKQVSRSACLCSPEYLEVLGSTCYPIIPLINHCPVTPQVGFNVCPRTLLRNKISYFPKLYRAACEPRHV